MNTNNMALITVLRSGIAREKEKISRAEDRLRDLEMELLELGIELPLHEHYPPNPTHA